MASVASSRRAPVRYRSLREALHLKLEVLVGAERAYDALHKIADGVHRVALPYTDPRRVVRRCRVDRQLNALRQPLLQRLVLRGLKSLRIGNVVDDAHVHQRNLLIGLACGTMSL